MDKVYTDWKQDCIEVLEANIWERDQEIIKLREALKEIKKTVECKQDKKYPSYFEMDAKDAVFILDTIENALLWSPK